MSIKIKKEAYGEFGKCLKITNGEVEIVAALEFGIRILHFGVAGGSNVFCLAPDVKVPAGGKQWSIYGGHRLWASPEEMPKTYFPDDKPVSYEADKESVIIKQPLDEWANIEKEITLSVSGRKVKLLHRITNRNGCPVELAAWAISVMAPGGIEIIPFSAPDTGLLHNRSISVWPYTDMNDSRVKWLKDYIILAHDGAVKGPFKIGISNKSGWAAYVNGQDIFIKRYRHIDGERYPDNNVSYETYTCDYMTEMETLSPLKFLAPGESVEHTEEWSVTHIISGSEPLSGQSVGKFLSELEPLVSY
jgi:hypothetical protein